MSHTNDPGARPAPAPAPSPSSQQGAPTPFCRPPPAIGLLGLGVLLIVLGPVLLWLASFGPVLLVAGLLSLVVGGVVVTMAARRMALGLEAVYDHIEATSMEVPPHRSESTF